MNILIYDPTHATFTLLEKMVEVFKITQIHVFYNNLNSLFEYSNIKDLITIRPIMDKGCDYIEQRSIYAIMNQISKPVFKDGQFVGFDILPTYMEGSKWDFYSNLELDHPNILILSDVESDGKRPQEYQYKSRLTNLIRKYDNIDNSCLDHICIYELDSIFDVSTNDVLHDFNALRRDINYYFKFDHIHEYMPLLMLHSLNLKTMKDFYRTYYSTYGFIEWDNRWLKWENDPSNYDDSSNYNDTDYQAETDYIRSNGGDWLFD